MVVGDFKAEEVLAQGQGAFGGIPRGAEPPPRARRRSRSRTASGGCWCARTAELPIVYLGYHVPNQKSPDAAALEVLSVILSGGRSSRLYRDLVHERQLALEAGGDYSYFSLDPNLFWFWATPLPGQTAETLEKELLGEMDQLKRGSRSRPMELTRAKNQIEASVRLPGRLDPPARLAAGPLRADRRLRAQGQVPRVASAPSPPPTCSASPALYFPHDKKNVGVLLPKP